jgi:hypothetical protein
LHYFSSLPPLPIIPIKTNSSAAFLYVLGILSKPIQQHPSIIPKPLQNINHPSNASSLDSLTNSQIIPKAQISKHIIIIAVATTQMGANQSDISNIGTAKGEGYRILSVKPNSPLDTKIDIFFDFIIDATVSKQP